MEHLLVGYEDGVWVVIKAVLLYLTAVIGFRLSKRRTLAEMSPFDFVVAVAVGAIVGRVPNSDDTAYLAGAITLLSLLVTHTVITHLRYIPAFSHVIDHNPRLLVADGQVLERELRKSGLTEGDLHGLLRHRGIMDLGRVKFVIFERRGKITVIDRDQDVESDLVRGIVDEATNP